MVHVCDLSKAQGGVRISGADDGFERATFILGSQLAAFLVKLNPAQSAFGILRRPSSNMNVESKTIRELSKHLRKIFATYLRQANGPRHTKFFEIRPGSKKYSDWDLRCFLVDEVEFDQVQQMVKFIESYPAFDDLGHFMTDAEEFADTGWHTARPKVIQIMAIMKDESHAPFFDLSIRNVKDSYVKRIFQESFNDEFIS
jgi:hypothetical protein